MCVLVLCSLGLTYDSAQLVGAVVSKEASHGVSARERAQRLLTVLMGLSQKNSHQSNVETVNKHGDKVQTDHGCVSINLLMSERIL